MPYTRPSFLRAFPVEGQRCCLAESLVWPVGVMDILPSAKKLVDLGERGDRCETVVELLLVGALGTLDVAVELRGAGWKDEEFDAALAAGVLELGHELGAAVDLDRSDREGQALEDRIQETRRGGRRGISAGGFTQPAGLLEVFQDATDH